MKNYAGNLDSALAAAQKKTSTEAAWMSFMMFSINAFMAYVFYFGGYLRWNEILNRDEPYTAGSIMVIMFCVVIGAAVLGMMAPHFKAISQSQIAARLAYDTIDHVPKVDPNNGGVPQDKVPSSLKGTFEFKNVSFKYPSRKDLVVLDNFSCTMNANETTALVGPSGSGKSTCIQLIERFYDPSEGQVLLDGKDLKEYDLRSVRQTIGYVGQEPVMFNQTIYENMKYSNPNATK